MRGATSGMLSPARQSRRKPPSSCCSFSAASALSLCLSVAVLTFMATSLGAPRGGKVAPLRPPSQLTEVSTLRKLAENRGEGPALRRGYERARHFSGGSGREQMETEEALESEHFASKQLQLTSRKRRDGGVRTRGGAADFGRPTEVPTFEWEGDPKRSGEAGVNKFDFGGVDEDTPVLGASKWERIERNSGGEAADHELWLSEEALSLGVEKNQEKSDVETAKHSLSEERDPRYEGHGSSARVHGKETTTANHDGLEEVLAAEGKGLGGTVTSEELAEETVTELGMRGYLGHSDGEGNELGDGSPSQALRNDVPSKESVGENQMFRKLVGSYPKRDTFVARREDDVAGQGTRSADPDSAESEMGKPGDKSPALTDSNRANPIPRVKFSSSGERNEIDTLAGIALTNEEADEANRILDHDWLQSGEKPTKQVKLVRQFFENNQIESRQDVKDNELSSDRIRRAEPSDEDLALSVLPDIGVDEPRIRGDGIRGGDSLRSAAEALPEATDGVREPAARLRRPADSLTNAVESSLEAARSSPSDAESLHSGVKMSESRLNGELNIEQRTSARLVGESVNSAYRRDLVGAFQEGLECMAPGLELFDGNASLLTGGSAYRTCAFVGNSGMMRAAERGAEIDGHDVVLRSNQAPTRGYEEFVGTKTTFRFLNKKWAVVYASSKQGRGVLLPQEDPGTVLIASRSEEPEYSRLVQAVGETRPDVGTVHLSGEVRRCAHVALQSARQAADEHGITYEGGDVPSTGFLAIFFLLQACESVDVYGLSMERSDGHVAQSWPYHYFEHYVDSENLRAHPHHSFEMEGDLIRALAVERPAQLSVTEETHQKEPE